MDPEPQRPDRHQPLPRVRPRPAKRSSRQAEEKVQIVSTQPELPVRCCTSQAPAIRIESATAMPPALRDTKLSCKIPVDNQRFRNTLKSKPGFSAKFPFSLASNQGFPIFFPAAAVPYWRPNAAFRNG